MIELCNVEKSIFYNSFWILYYNFSRLTFIARDNEYRAKKYLRLTVTSNRLNIHIEISRNPAVIDIAVKIRVTNGIARYTDI